MLLAGNACGGGEKLNKTQDMQFRHPATTPNKEFQFIDGGVSWQNIPNCGCLQLYFEKSCVVSFCPSCYSHKLQ